MLLSICPLPALDECLLDMKLVSMQGGSQHVSHMKFKAHNNPNMCDFMLQNSDSKQPKTEKCSCKYKGITGEFRVSNMKRFTDKFKTIKGSFLLHLGFF